MISFSLSNVSLVWERPISGISAPEVLVALTPFLLLLLRRSGLSLLGAI